MQSSKTSSIANASKNLHWDGVRVRNTTVFGAAAVNTVANAAAGVFPRSRALGKDVNPNTNKGLVHLIHMVVFEYMAASSAAASNAAARAITQIRRRDPGAGALDPVSIAEGSPIDAVIVEDFATIRSFQESTGTAGTVTANDVNYRNTLVFPTPMVAVMPYFLKLRSLMSSAAIATVTLDCNCYVLVESIRISEQKYRRLLDAYTQVPALQER